MTSFHSPTHPSYGFAAFYERLAELGFVIYPGKVSRADCFRIGTIGRLEPRDLEALVGAVRQVLVELGVPIPISER
jgi:2-aminoethylphosphonate-pyruvate transaminase